MSMLYFLNTAGQNASLHRTKSSSKLEDYIKQNKYYLILLFYGKKMSDKLRQVQKVPYIDHLVFDLVRNTEW